MLNLFNYRFCYIFSISFFDNINFIVMIMIYIFGIYGERKRTKGNTQTKNKPHKIKK